MLIIKKQYIVYILFSIIQYRRSEVNRKNGFFHAECAMPRSWRQCGALPHNEEGEIAAATQVMIKMCRKRHHPAAYVA